MKKSGFTMIELIFVIVILGILAAVAVPKMMATRTNAEVVKVSQNTVSAIKEIPSWVLSQGRVDSNLSKMSAVLEQLESSGDVTIDTDNKEAIIKTKANDGSLENCIDIKVIDSDKNLSVEHDSGSGDVCVGVQKKVHELVYPLGGQTVQF